MVAMRARSSLGWRSGTSVQKSMGFPLPVAGATELSTLLAVFLFGLLGGTHCAGMCGGIVATLNRPAPSLRIQPVAPHRPDPSSAEWARQLVYHAGRIVSYTLAGAIAASIGSAAMLAERLLPMQQIAFVAGSFVMAAMGLHMLGVRRVSEALERIGQRVWPMVRPLAHAALGKQGLRGALATGLAWGWVPCAMVYGALALAIVSAHPLSGATIMLVFGLGTTPALVGLSWASRMGIARLESTTARRAVGLAILLFASAGLARLDPVGRIQQLGELCLSWVRS
jgi:sulfite exporter TauE/SafE